MSQRCEDPETLEVGAMTAFFWSVTNIFQRAVRTSLEKQLDPLLLRKSINLKPLVIFQGWGGGGPDPLHPSTSAHDKHIA